MCLLWGALFDEAESADWLECWGVLGMKLDDLSQNGCLLMVHELE